jgi:hypothetical protein
MAPYRSNGKEPGGSTSELFASDDGLTWNKIYAIGNVSPRTNETELSFAPDGTLRAYLRCERGVAAEGKDNPSCGFLAKACPPYTQWEYEQTKFVGGPLLFTWNEKLYLIGRTYLQEDQKIAPWDTGDRTAVFQVVPGDLKRKIILPSGGDSSYAGVAALPNGNILVSYYSSHEFAACPTEALVRSAIYMAEIQSKE